MGSSEVRTLRRLLSATPEQPAPKTSQAAVELPEAVIAGWGSPPFILARPSTGLVGQHRGHRMRGADASASDAQTSQAPVWKSTTADQLELFHMGSTYSSMSIVAARASSTMNPKSCRFVGYRFLEPM